jgi:WXG100 family type VII secretion target
MRGVETPGEDSIRVTPETLMAVSSEFSNAANELRSEFAAVNRDVDELLGYAWKGGAATEFSSVWQEWNAGSNKVQTGLTDMVELLKSAAAGYRKIDQSGAAAVERQGG